MKSSGQNKKHNKRKAKMRAQRRMRKIVGFFVVAILFAIPIAVAYCGRLTASAALKRDAEYMAQWDDAAQHCEELFDGLYVKVGVTKDVLQACYDDLGDLGGLGDAVANYDVIERAMTYLEYSEALEANYAKMDELPLSELAAITSISERDLEIFNGEYRERAGKIVAEMHDYLKNIEVAQEAVDALFDGDEVSEDIDRDDYDEAYEATDKVRRAEIKEALAERLDVVEEEISERERIAWEKAEAERQAREAAERERQAKIAAAWHYVDVPYISQNRQGVYNGCEAASMLMALQYKGYLTDMSLWDYAEMMPKSSDPYKGFYLDIFGVEPRNVSHWIDSTPLAEFGRESSGYSEIYDLKGSSVEDLAEEIMAGNPVIVWLSYDFREPYNWSGEAKMYKNLHVMVLSGYNSETGQFRVTDPWTRNDGSYLFYLNWGTVESIYETIGERAVVVR